MYRNWSWRRACSTVKALSPYTNRGSQVLFDVQGLPHLDGGLEWACIRRVGPERAPCIIELPMSVSLQTLATKVLKALPSWGCYDTLPTCREPCEKAGRQPMFTVNGARNDCQRRMEETPAID